MCSMNLKERFVIFIEAPNLQRPLAGDVVFGRVGIVHDYDLGVREERVRVEEAAIGRHRDAVGVFIGGTSFRRIVPDFASERLNRQAVFGRRLLHHLVHQLPGWAEIDHPLSEFTPPPLGQQQPHQRLAAAGGQLQGDVRRLQSLGDIGAQDLALMIEKAGVLAPRQVPEETVGAFWNGGLDGRLLEGHGF
jgi:hypothetical protein